MSHTHKFNHIGGGCKIDIISKTACDDDYKCKCGASFRAYTSMTGHYYLPEFFEAQELSEIKKAEIEAISQAVKANEK